MHQARALLWSALSRGRRTHARIALGLVGLAVLAGAGAGVTAAAFTGATGNEGNLVAMADDLVAPDVDRSVVANSAGGDPGFVRQGSSYRVYAHVTDDGNPASGVAAVTADLSSVSASEDAVGLTDEGGPWTLDGVVYNHRSADVLTVDGAASQGAKPYSVTAVDAAGNSGTADAFEVVVDNTAPTLDAYLIHVPDGRAGYLRPGSTYRLYATATDAGDPPSGVRSLQADLSPLTAGADATVLEPGSWTIDGATYTSRSEELVADAGLADGAVDYTVALTDHADNTATPTRSVVVDGTGPTVVRAAVQKGEGGSPGAVRQGGSYHVYADVTDAGSGVDTVTADVSALTGGATTIPLVSTGGPWTVDGLTYSHRTAETASADGSLAEGSKPFSVTGTDAVGNTHTETGFSAVVDNTLPTVTVLLARASGTTVTNNLRQGDTFHVYANVSDGGNPASGLWTVTADVSSAVPGQTAVPLVAGSWSFNGVSYSHRTALLTAGSPLAEGAYPYSVTGTDHAGNPRTTSGSATVSTTYVFKGSGGTGAGCAGGTGQYDVRRDMEIGYIPAGSEESHGNRNASANFCSDPFAAGATLAGGVTVVEGWFTSTNTQSCNITATLYSGTTPLGSGAIDLPGNVNTATYRTWSFATSETTFAAGDRLNLTLTWSNGAHCSNQILHWNTAAYPARVTTPATVDTTPPVVTGSVIMREGGTVAGHIDAGGEYRVYANATDAGGSNINTVTADVTDVTDGQDSVNLVSTGGPWTIGGTTYAYRSAVRVADAGHAEGSRSYSVTATDHAANTQTYGGFSVQIDTTPPVVGQTAAVHIASGTVGYVTQGSTYRLYAQVTDNGPVADVTADMSLTSAGQTAVQLSAGSWTVDDVIYTHRSGVLTADAPLGEGAKAYTVTGTDAAGHTHTIGGSVTVDNSAPAVPASTLVQEGSLVGGTISQGDPFRVYAALDDPGSGPAGATGDVSAVASGETEVALTATGGPWTVDGVTYGWRSEPVMADTIVEDGTYDYTVTASDRLGLSSTISFQVEVSNTAPAIPASTVTTTSGGPAPYIRPGAGFLVYADVVDTYSAGLAAVTADVSTVAAGQTAVPMTDAGGPWTVDGITYGWRSTEVLADVGLADGDVTYEVTAVNDADNDRTEAFTALVDGTPPVIAASVIRKTQGGTHGAVRQGGTYHVYAQVTDGASGMGTVTTDVSALTPGATARAMTTSGGPWTIAGVQYNYRTASQVTADGSLAEGITSYSVTATDAVENSATEGFTVVVDNTAPTATVQIGLTPDGEAVGHVRQGDTYRVYADVADGGNPASGIWTVAADVSSITAGQTAVNLTAGTFTFGGLTYNYRSAILSADAELPNGSYAYSVAATDHADNASVTGGTAEASTTYVFAGGTAFTGNNCTTATKRRDLRLGHTPAGPEETFNRVSSNVTLNLCTDAFATGATIPAGTTTVQGWFRNTAGSSCTVTARLWRNGTEALGSAVGLSVPANSALTARTINLSTAGTTFAAGDRLNLVLNWEQVKACDSTHLHWNTASAPSNVVLPSTGVGGFAVIGVVGSVWLR